MMAVWIPVEAEWIEYEPVNGHEIHYSCAKCSLDNSQKTLI